MVPSTETQMLAMGKKKSATLYFMPLRVFFLNELVQFTEEQNVSKG